PDAPTPKDDTDLITGGDQLSPNEGEGFWSARGEGWSPPGARAGRHRSHHRRRPALAPGGPEPLALVRRVHHLDHRQLLAGLRPRRLRNGRSRLHHLPHGTSRKAGMTPAWTSSTPNC